MVAVRREPLPRLSTDGAKRDFDARVGARIGNERRRRGMSQPDAAKLARVSRDQLAKIESGDAACSIYSLARLAEAWDVTIEALVPDVEVAS